MEQYYAHSGNKPDKSDWQLLRDHSRAVAKLARQFAEESRPGDKAFADAAYLAGLLHDLGKYREEFQEMLLQKRQRGASTRHKQIGASHAFNSKRYDLAFAVFGHHGGIPDRSDLKELRADGVGTPKEVLNKIWPVAKVAD